MGLAHEFVTNLCGEGGGRPRVWWRVPRPAVVVAFSLRFLPVQLVVLFHCRYGVHRAEQYFCGDLNAPGRRGRSVAGTAAGRRRTVAAPATAAAARAVQALGRPVVVHVAAARRPSRRTFRHPRLRRPFRYLRVKKKKNPKLIIRITRTLSGVSRNRKKKKGAFNPYKVSGFYPNPISKINIHYTGIGPFVWSGWQRWFFGNHTDGVWLPNWLSRLAEMHLSP